MFHNTIDLIGQELVLENAKTMHQEELITNLFKALPDKAINPSAIRQFLIMRYDRDIPLTSVRRAISDLTKSSVLIKTTVKRKGTYHLNEHCWALNTQDNQRYIEKVMPGESTSTFANKIIESSINKSKVQPALDRDLFSELGG